MKAEVKVEAEAMAGALDLRSFFNLNLNLSLLSRC